MRHFCHGLLAIGLSVFCLAEPASAAIIQVSSRASLGANLSIDWGLFGPAGSGISTPYGVTVGPEMVRVSSSQGQLGRHREGTDFTGNFAIGDQLLTDAGSQSDTMSVTFASAPVRAAGTQIEIDSPRPAPFTAHMDFYGAGSVLLGEVTVAATGTTAENNSAIFIGGTSTAADIVSVFFWVDNPVGFFPARSANLAINRLDVAVPAPGGRALLLPILGWLFRRARQQRSAG